MDHIEAEATQYPMDWGAGGKVHNWRNYVGKNVRAIWGSFNAGQKIAIARDADELASREDWD